MSRVVTLAAPHSDVSVPRELPFVTIGLSPPGTNAFDNLLATLPT